MHNTMNDNIDLVQRVSHAAVDALEPRTAAALERLKHLDAVARGAGDGFDGIVEMLEAAVDELVELKDELVHHKRALEGIYPAALAIDTAELAPSPEELI